jgi:exodeoxyribonuclease VII large subunit
MLGAHGRPRLLTVTQLATGIRDLLDEGVGWVWVAGELSSVRRSATRHLYFTLKDEGSQLAAVMFWRAAQVLPFDPADGLDVVVLGRLDLYAPRGALQLVVERMEPQGLGALRLAFEQLKARLDAEGLFAASRKRPLPALPRTVGIVTALPGAAVHDMLTTLRRRWPAARVVVRPVRVQGPGAPQTSRRGSRIEPPRTSTSCSWAGLRTRERSWRGDRRVPRSGRLGRGREIGFTIAT